MDTAAIVVTYLNTIHITTIRDSMGCKSTMGGQDVDWARYHSIWSVVQIIPIIEGGIGKWTQRPCACDMCETTKCFVRVEILPSEVWLTFHVWHSIAALVL